MRINNSAIFLFTIIYFPILYNNSLSLIIEWAAVLLANKLKIKLAGIMKPTRINVIFVSKTFYLPKN